MVLLIRRRQSGVLGGHRGFLQQTRASLLPQYLGFPGRVTDGSQRLRHGCHTIPPNGRDCGAERASAQWLLVRHLATPMIELIRHGQCLLPNWLRACQSLREVAPSVALDAQGVHRFRRSSSEVLRQANLSRTGSLKASPEIPEPDPIQRLGRVATEPFPNRAPPRARAIRAAMDPPNAVAVARGSLRATG